MKSEHCVCGFCPLELFQSNEELAWPLGMDPSVFEDLATVNFIKFKGFNCWI